MKNAPHHILLQTRKLKQPWDTITYVLERQHSKTLALPNAGQDEERQKLSFITGGSAKWYSPFGRQFLIKLNIFLLYIPVVALLAIYSKSWKLIACKNLHRNYFLIHKDKYCISKGHIYLKYKTTWPNFCSRHVHNSNGCEVLLHRDVYSSFIHNCQDLEVTKRFFSR